MRVQVEKVNQFELRPACAPVIDKAAFALS